MDTNNTGETNKPIENKRFHLIQDISAPSPAEILQARNFLEEGKSYTLNVDLKCGVREEIFENVLTPKYTQVGKSTAKSSPGRIHVLFALTIAKKLKETGYTLF